MFSFLQFQPVPLEHSFRQVSSSALRRDSSTPSRPGLAWKWVCHPRGQTLGESRSTAAGLTLSLWRREKRPPKALYSYNRCDPFTSSVQIQASLVSPTGSRQLVASSLCICRSTLLPLLRLISQQHLALPPSIGPDYQLAVSDAVAFCQSFYAMRKFFATLSVKYKLRHGLLGVRTGASTTGVRQYSGLSVLADILRQYVSSVSVCAFNVARCIHLMPFNVCTPPNPGMP